ncbi:MAG: metallophosphoesterase family protein [Anaerolineae bacterium]
MRRVYSLRFAIYGFLGFVLIAFTRGMQAEPPQALYLSWRRDPTTTISIYWHTSEKDRSSSLYYRQVGEGSDWHFYKGGSKLVGEKRHLRVHYVELEHLKEGADYVFKLEEEGELYQFRTLPKVLERPVKIVIAGDAYHEKDRFSQISRLIVKADPDFIVLGGDIAYATIRASLFQRADQGQERWEAFFYEWTRQMVTPDGRLIPLIPIIGNHDVPGKRKDPKQEQILFYEWFTFPDPFIAYRILDCGNYLSLVLLDSGHTYSVKKEQTEWLHRALRDHGSFPYQIAAYHIAAYPSVYPFEGKTAKKIRQNWVPLFENYGVQAAFEHHNHAFKRTQRIKEGRIDLQGVVYIGDGSWGVSPRKPRSSKNSWYLAKTASANTFSVMTLLPDYGVIESFGAEGERLDQVAILPRAQNIIPH